MEYYIVRRGGHPYYESFLNTTTINQAGPTDKDFGSFKNAYKFMTAHPAHVHVRVFKDDFQGSVILTDDTNDLYELVVDPRK